MSAGKMVKKKRKKSSRRKKSKGKLKPKINDLDLKEVKKTSQHGIGLAIGFIMTSIFSMLIVNRVITYFSWIEIFPIWMQFLVLGCFLVIGSLIFINSWKQLEAK